MPRTFAFASFALFTVILAGARAPERAEGSPRDLQSIDATHTAPHPTCPAGAIWTGDRCRTQRTIVLEESVPPPPPPPPPPPNVLSLDWWLSLIS